MQLDRQDLIDGLSELIRKARANGLTGISIRIVGGAALRLGHFDRGTTSDIDARIEPFEPLLPIIEEIARDRGWPIDIDSVSAAEDLFENFYPGDGLPERTVRLLERIIQLGLPVKPPAPPTPHFT